MLFPGVVSSKNGRVPCLAAVLLALLPRLVAADPAATALFDLSLDDLMNLDVTTVSRKSESSRDAPTAIYVITREDLRRNHVTHIAEALRMVPGMHVARIDGNRWAVNMRESPSYFSNRMLVQMDGRTLYSPVFSGTFWNVQDTVLEDVERIEVIRGPGAVMWGANAVNGIVNIITRNAADTEGTLATLNLGSEDRIAQYRHGLQMGEDWFGRFYLRTRRADDLRQLEGGDNNDDWRMQQGGFRLDSRPDGLAGRFTLQGDLYKGQESVRGVFPASGGGFPLDHSDAELRGMNILGRWTRALEEGGEFQLQAYYDRTVRLTPGIIDIRLDIYDLEFQHLLAPVPGHELIWGGGFRLTQDDFDGNPLFFYTPAQTSRRRWTGFVQYDFEALPDALNLIAGVKLEYNDFTGFEYQPGVKLLWKPSESQTVWASVSRAIRTADRSEHDINLALAQPFPVLFPGLFAYLRPAPDTESEKLQSLDVGHRWQLNEHFSWDVALFSKQLREELTVTQQQANPLVFLNENIGKEDHYGGEVVFDWQPRDWWQVQAWWAYIEPKHRENAVSRNHANLRSYMNLDRGIEVDGTLRYVDARASGNIPSYVELDLRFGWHASRDLEFSLAFNHLLDNETLEAPPQSFIRFQQAEIQRSVSLKVTWTPWD